MVNKKYDMSLSLLSRAENEGQLINTEENEEDEEEKLLSIGELALYPPGFRFEVQG